MALRITLPELDAKATTYVTAALQNLGATIHIWPEWHHNKALMFPVEFRSALLEELKGSYPAGVPPWFEDIRIEILRRQ